MAGEWGEAGLERGSLVSPRLCCAPTRQRWRERSVRHFFPCVVVRLLSHPAFFLESLRSDLVWRVLAPPPSFFVFRDAANRGLCDVIKTRVFVRWCVFVRLIDLRDSLPHPPLVVVSCAPRWAPILGSFKSRVVGPLTFNSKGFFRLRFRLL